MVSRYNLLYDESPEEFDLSSRRFLPSSQVSMLTQLTLSSKRHTVNDLDVQEYFRCLDMLSIKSLYSLVEFFTSNDLSRDLNLEQVVNNLLCPRFTPRFQLDVLTNPPVDLRTTLYRQEAVRELIEKPNMAKCLEDGTEMFAQLICSVLNRAYVCSQLARSWDTPKRHNLKVLMSYNLDILQKYTAMINQFTETLKDAESKPMRRLGEYFTDVRSSQFFKDIFPVFDVSYFKDYRISLNVAVGLDGVLNGSEYQGAERASKVPAFKLISKTGALGFIPAFFKMFCLPSTFAMDATNTVVEKNLDALLKVGEIIAPLEFYTGGAAFYRRMKGINMPVQLPTVLLKEERRMELPNARNPLLLYQKGVNTWNISRVIPNDIKYDRNQNIFVITGPNNGGKTCYVKTSGLLQLLGQNGLPVTAEGEAYISIVDGVHTMFVSPDDIMAGEGRLLHDLKKVEKIVRKATPYSTIILDEPCGGTEHSEGTRQTVMIVDGLRKLGSTVYLTTHLPEVAETMDRENYPEVRNLQVGIKEDPDSKRLIKTYKILPGKAICSYGAEVAREVGLTPESISAMIEERVHMGGLDRALLREK